jgi:hypothetical protein
MKMETNPMLTFLGDSTPLLIMAVFEFFECVPFSKKQKEF